MTTEGTQKGINSKIQLISNVMFCFNRKHRVRDESPTAAWTREANFEQNVNALLLPNSDPYYMPTLSDPSLAAGDSTNGRVNWTIGCE